MRPTNTSLAPTHSTVTTLPAMMNIAKAVSRARAKIAVRAARKASSTLLPKRRLAIASLVKAWRVRTAPSVSEA